MSTEMRKYMDSFKEFSEKGKMMEVIISYDCNEIHDPFGANLLQLLQDNPYNSEQITKSNYKIGNLLMITKIDSLKKEIIRLFDESISINEGITLRKTIVKIITPIENQFIIDTIINVTV